KFILISTKNANQSEIYLLVKTNTSLRLQPSFSKDKHTADKNGNIEYKPYALVHAIYT
ncbi:8609_t:CDS:1, partial [Racocetra persica]